MSVRAVPRVPQHRAGVRIDHWGSPMHYNHAARYITAANGVRKRWAASGVDMRKAYKPMLRPLANEERRSWSNSDRNNAGARFNIDNPYVRAVLLPRHERAIVVEQKLLGLGLGGGGANEQRGDWERFNSHWTDAPFFALRYARPPLCQMVANGSTPASEMPWQVSLFGIPQTI